LSPPLEKKDQAVWDQFLEEIRTKFASRFVALKFKEDNFSLQFWAGEMFVLHKDCRRFRRFSSKWETSTSKCQKEMEVLVRKYFGKARVTSRGWRTATNKCTRIPKDLQRKRKCMPRMPCELFDIL
jgi:hypothetical protein